MAEFERVAPACMLGTGTKTTRSGLGRIVRDPAGRFRDRRGTEIPTPDQRKITEVNMSCYVFNCRDLLLALGRDPVADNSQGEYYLTDCPGILLAAGKTSRH